MKLIKIEYVTMKCMLSPVSFEFPQAFRYMVLHVRAFEAVT